MTYKEFFKALGNTKPLCFYDYKIPVDYTEIPKYINDYELVFIPNIGGIKTDNITVFKAFFIDLDCGRDKDGNYFNLNFVKNYKSEKLSLLKNFEIKPNAIIETRNGLHAYWFIREKITYDRWKSIEDALILHFGGDSSVSTPAHKMRIPNSLWLKDKKHSFRCKIVYSQDVINYIEAYCKLLKDAESGIKSVRSKNFYQSPSITSKKDVKAFKSYKEIFDYLTKEVSMFEYLREFYNLKGNNPNSFNCIIHNDKNPSANIFKVDSGIELYYCRSTGCGFTGNIIQVVAFLEHSSRRIAIDKLCRDLSLKYEDDIDGMRFLLDNMRTINDDIQYSHRDLYGVAFRYLPTLSELHKIALDNIIYSNYEDDFVFSASTNYVAKRLGRSDKKNTGTDLSLLCLLKLLNKIDLDNEDVPQEYKEYIRRYQEKCADSPYYKHINVYSLPAYTYETLSECNEMARLVKEKGLRKKNFTYESVANAFDTETADRVFPQIKHKTVKPIDEELLNIINILLEKDGYFTQNTVQAYYYENNIFYKESQYIKQLPAIMQQLNLEKIKASKKIKEQYGILSAGFPYIYRKKS